MPRSIAKLADDASLLLWDVPFPSFVFEALGTSIRHHLEGGSKSPSAYQNLTLPHTRVLEDSRLLAIRLREMSVDRLPEFGNGIRRDGLSSIRQANLLASVRVPYGRGRNLVKE
jgi:hypothetical protein